MNERLLEWAPRLAFLAAVLLVAWAAARLTGTLMLPGPDAPATAAAESAGQAMASAADHAARILSAKLMGEAPKAAPARRQAVPETRLNIKLIGVLATGEQSGMAIISDGRGEEKIYRVGSRLPGGAQLEEVLEDRVMLNGPSGLETLKLYEPEQAGGSLLSPVSQAAGARRSSSAGTAGFSGRDAGGRFQGRFGGDDGGYEPDAGGARRFGFSRQGSAGVVGSEAGVTEPGAEGMGADLREFADRARDGVDASELSALREELVRNPAQLSGMVNAREVRRDGGVVGYALEFQVNDPAIAELGLQSGDVVTEVNGISLTSPAQGLRALNTLTSASRVTATLERGGQVVNVSHSFE